MPNSTPSRPAKPFQAYPLQKIIKSQAWVILLMVIIGLAFEIFYGNTQGKIGFIVTKNLLAGNVLAWIGQMVFAKISLGLSGYHQRRQIVHRIYLAHMVKWVLTLIGFAIIFKFLRPLQALWVLVGFIAIQLSYMLMMYRQKSS